MASRGFWKCRIGRAVGQSLRLFVAGLVACFAFLFMIDIGNGGFLPSMRRSVWIEARSDSGAWAFRVAGASPIDATPPPVTAGCWTLGLRESSMGRSGGPGGEWRAHNWTLIEAIDPASQGVDGTADPTISSKAFQDPLDAFVRAEVIPASEALAIWSKTPAGPVQYLHEAGFSIWTVWQHRDHPWVVMLIGGLALAAGLAAALILNPRWCDTPVPPAR